MAVILAGTGAGIGILGVFFGLRRTTTSLETLARSVARPVTVGSLLATPGRIDESLGRRLVLWVGPDSLHSNPRWASLRSCLSVTGGTWEELATKMVMGGGAGLLLPPLLWAGGHLVGISLPLAAPIVLALVAIPAGMGIPVAELRSAAADRRRHVRLVVGTFVDLVVLGLAGGVGTEGALFAAVEVSPDWAFRRMARALSKSRDSGVSPWAALGQLGEEMGVGELVELSATLQLAGTEGARIRQSLTARSATLRRHEQADAESGANAATQRMFLPGALLLIGFLLFIGYPAFSRILGGF